MKNIYCLFFLVCACLSNLSAEKFVAIEITGDNTHHIELIFPNDWDVELKHNDIKELHVYDNNSPAKIFVWGVEKPSMPHKVWVKDRDKLLDDMFDDNDFADCTSYQIEQKIAYPNVAPLIYSKVMNYLCEEDGKTAYSMNFLETEDHVIYFGLILFDPPTQDKMHARLQAFANCIHIVPNKVYIR